MGTLLEICVDGPAGIAAAVAGGSDRIELCAGLELGGLTPSAGMIGRAVATGLPVHVLIRPRAGDFLVDDAELDVMLADISRALALGAAGVVVGALNRDGRLDGETLARFRDAARDRAAVLHRAIDLVPDPVAAIERVCTLGYDGVLSSGGAASAPAGAAMLALMVRAARGRLAVIAGAGVRPDNVAALVAATGVREVHASASQAVAPPDARLMELGFAHGARGQTDAATIEALRGALRQAEELE